MVYAFELGSAPTAALPGIKDVGNAEEGLKGMAVVEGDIDPCMGLLPVGVN